jgi:hypothetical protein
MMWYDFALRTAAALTLWALIGAALTIAKYPQAREPEPAAWLWSDKNNFKYRRSR